MKIVRVFALIMGLILLLPGEVGSAGEAARRVDEPGDYRLYYPVAVYNLPPEWLGPEGGLIAAVAYAPSNPQVVYAGAWGGGVYRSDDSGEHWSWRSRGLDNLTVVSLAVDPLDPETLYVGTYKSGLFKSSNGGATWMAVNQGIQEQAIVYSIVINPDQPQIVYCATRGPSNGDKPPWKGVIYRSTDGGASWSVSLANLGGVSYQDWIYALAISATQPEVLFAAAHEHGPLRSQDGGKSWEILSNGISNLSTRGIVVGSSAATARTVYTGVWTKSGVFKSTNLGDEWTLQDKGVSGSQIYGMDMPTNQTEQVYLATFNKGVVKTNNGGDSWYTAGLRTNPVAVVRVNPGDSRQVYAGTAGNGLFRSRDGGLNWTPDQAGLKASSATGLVASFEQAGTLYVGLDGGGVLRSTDGGVTWGDFSQGMSSRWVNLLVNQPGGTRLFALTDDAGLYRCDLHDLQHCWEAVGQNVLSVHGQPGLVGGKKPFASQTTFFETMLETEDRQAPVAVPGNLGLLALAFAPANPQVAYLGGYEAGVYKTSDGGETWSASGLSPATVWGLAVDAADPARVYAATDQAGAVWMSSDGGASWTPVELGNQTVYSLAISSAQGDLIAGTQDGVFRMVGGNWVQIGLAGATVTWLAYDPVDANLLFAGTLNGAYVSRDGGDSWPIATGLLAGHAVHAISFDPFNEHTVYYSTTAHGVLRGNK